MPEVSRSGFKEHREKQDPLQRAKDAINADVNPGFGGTIDTAHQAAAQRAIAFALIALVEELRRSRPPE